MSESRDTLERITALERKVERLIGLDKNTMWIFDKLESRIAALEGTASRRDPGPVCGCQRNGFECDGSCEEYEERMQRRREEVAPAQPATVDEIMVPRDLLDRAVDHIKRLGWWETEVGDDTVSQSAYADAAAIRAMLEGA